MTSQPERAFERQPVEDFDWPCDRRDAHGPHEDCRGVAAHPATMAGAVMRPKSERPQIVRADRYTVLVNGHRVRADERAERALRSLTPSQMALFLHTQGVTQ